MNYYDPNGQQLPGMTPPPAAPHVPAQPIAVHQTPKIQPALDPTPTLADIPTAPLSVEQPVAKVPVPEPVTAPQPAPEVVPEAPKAEEKPVMTAPETLSAAEFEPSDEDLKRAKEKEAQEQSDEVDVTTILQQAERANDEDENLRYNNIERITPAVPCSTVDKIDDYVNRLSSRNQDALRADLADVTSDLSVALEAERNLTLAHDTLQDSLAKVPVDKLQRHYQGLGDGTANLNSKFKESNVYSLKDANDALLMFNTALGGLRQITLWNSGFKISLRSIPLYVLNQYYSSVNHSDYEYGRSFGAPYYLFSDYNITKTVIETILPVAICGSTYKHWRDRDKLLAAISFQDYPTIIWAIGAMLHPNGAEISFVCAEEGCGNVIRETVDLNKLRLINTDLINDQMVEFFKTKSKDVDDNDLEEYRKLLGLNKTVEFEYTVSGIKKHWKVGLKQCSLSEYLDLGNEYLNDMMAEVSLDNERDVTNFINFNFMRSYKPWIETIEFSFGKEGQPMNTMTYNTKEVTGNTTTTNQVLDAILEELTNNYAKFSELVREYILDTKISHIAFYFPKCPKCGKEPSASYHGYMAYDPQRNFFTQALMRLIQVNSTPTTD